MSLATRCTACGTVFRVVLDQLRVSEGWVRCGRCNGVFDATEALFDIDSGAAIRLQADASEAAPAPLMTMPGTTAPPDDSDLQPAPQLEVPAEEPLPPPAAELTSAWPAPVEPMYVEQVPTGEAGHYDPRDEPLLRAPSRDGEGDADAQDQIIITDHVPGETTAAALQGLADDAPGLLAATDRPASDPQRRIDPQLDGAKSPAQAAPLFIRSAQRSQGWRRPALRASLWTATLLLALAAVLQAAVLWRDALAAQWPQAKPALQALCRLAGCSVQPLRRIEALSVESSGLNRLEGTALYRLQLSLRNLGATVLMMPALELSLNDGQGGLVARRVLSAADLGLRETALAPGQTLPVSAVLSTGGRRVEGYTLELFYP